MTITLRNTKGSPLTHAELDANFTSFQSTDSASDGDALVGFKQSNSSGHLSGAIARTVHQKLQEIVSVKDFGAVGDGVTDDTSAFTAAAAAGKPFIPPASYKITGTVTGDFWTSGGVTIVSGTVNTINNIATGTFNSSILTGVEKQVRFRTQGSTHFTSHVASAVNNGTRDDVLYIAYNLSEGSPTTKATAGEPQLKLSMEADYNDATNHLMELNLDYLSDDNAVSRRPIYVTVGRSGPGKNHVGMVFSYHTSDFDITEDGAATPTFRITGSTHNVAIGAGTVTGVKLLVNGSVIRNRSSTNTRYRSDWQVETAGSYVEINGFDDTGLVYIPGRFQFSSIELLPTTGDIKWGKALVALGGGAAPTLGTIGGSGPATAAQNSWMRVLDSTGAAFWVPAWK